MNSEFYANQLDFSVILLFLKGNIHVLTVLVWFSSFHSMWDKIITFVKKLIQKFYFSILDWPKQLCYMLFNKMMKKLRLYWCTGYHGLYYIYKVAQTQCLFFPQGSIFTLIQSTSGKLCNVARLLIKNFFLLKIVTS